MISENKILRYSKWKKWICDQEKSGLGQKAFCAQHQLSFPQFLYYRNKIKAQSENKHEIPELFSKVEIKEPIFLEKSGIDLGLQMKIQLPNGVVCQIEGDLTTPKMKHLMGVLLSC